LLERHAGVPVAHVFVKIEVGKRRDDHNLSGEIRQEFGHAGNQFRELEAGEGTSNLDAAIELGEGHVALAREALEQARIGGVRAVEEEHTLAFREQARQEVVAEPRHVARAMKDRQAALRQRPRFM
jgi:hypothetical protein